VIEAVGERSGVPLWLPWPLPESWLVAGVAWAGDDRSPSSAVAVACSGPAPLSAGTADLVFVAEEPGVGLGARYAGMASLDPGPLLPLLGTTAPHATVSADRHATPLWSVETHPDRSVYIGEAEGLWLWVIAWPTEAGYLLAEDLTLVDCREKVPWPLPCGAPSPRLSTR
jgi:hypothetical protein